MKIAFVLLIIAFIYLYIHTHYTMYKLKRRITTLELFLIGFFPVIGCLIFLYSRRSEKKGHLNDLSSKQRCWIFYHVRLKNIS